MKRVKITSEEWAVRKAATHARRLQDDKDRYRRLKACAPEVLKAQDARAWAKKRDGFNRRRNLKAAEAARAKRIAAGKPAVREAAPSDPVSTTKRSFHTRVPCARTELAATAEVLLGCSDTEFRCYLESKFAPGMGWRNFGVRGWHVDHIIPCAAFDLTDPDQQRQCFHYTNLQPLWSDLNEWKRNKVVPKEELEYEIAMTPFPC